MATNKRKEAAALFELIDKSTLKVPKNTGSLKIPTWWSSKTNPPVPGGGPTTEGAAGGGPEGQHGAAGKAAGAAGRATTEAVNGHGGHGAAGVPSERAVADAAPGREKGPEGGKAAEATGANAGAGAGSQQRMFQPPPAGAMPATTPSIRPPSRMVASPAAVKPDSAAEAEMPPAKEAAPIVDKAPAGIEKRETLGAAAATSLSAAGVGSRGSMAPGGTVRKWKPEDRTFLSQFSRVPPAALIGAGAAVLLLFLLILYLATRGKSATPAPAHSFETPIVAPGSGDAGGAAVIPATPGRLEGGGPAAQPPAAAGAAPAAAATTGRVYEPNTYSFSPDAMYVYIASSSSETVTRRNAKFLADHGIDVAIEKSGNDYVLIAAHPFANNVAAEPYVRKIREIGKLHPDYRSNQKVFADAYLRRVRIGTAK